jgi:hypothetical protein
MSETKSQMGRPKKSKDRRIQMSFYIPTGVMDTIADYVEERQRTAKGYSRSDFINEAIEKHMRDLGLAGGEDDGAVTDGRRGTAR